MSKPPEMPKLKNLRPMAPDDPFYRRGYLFGVPVFGPKPSARDADSMRRSEKMSRARATVRFGRRSPWPRSEVDAISR